MMNLVEMWVNLVVSMSATIEDIPSKIKGAVVERLAEIGYVTENDLPEVKDAKIAEMDLQCNQTIVNGFDIELSDGESHHFSLKIEDQLKISKLNDRVNANIDTLPYHADGEECKFFSKEDVQKINATMENIIEYQVTYFNSLKAYIDSLSTVEEVNAITYGVDIPEEYQSEVLKALNSQKKGE